MLVHHKNSVRKAAPVLTAHSNALNDYLAGIGPDSFVTTATLTVAGGSYRAAVLTTGAVQYLPHLIQSTSYNVSFSFILRDVLPGTLPNPPRLYFVVTATVKWEYSNYNAVDETLIAIPFSENKLLGTVKWRGLMIPLLRSKRPATPIHNSDASSRYAHYCYPHVQYRDMDLSNRSSIGSRERGSVQGAHYQLQVLGSPILNHFSRDAPSAIRARFSASGLTERTVFFIGDSHLRFLYHYWVSFLENATAATEKISYQTRHTVIEPLNTSSAPIRFTSKFQWDPFLNETLYDPGLFTSVLRRGDVLVLGIGSWPASFAHWSLETFYERLRNVTIVLRRLAVQFVVVVYAGAPAVPKWRAFIDWFRISNYRMILMNHFARHALLYGGDTCEDATSGTSFPEGTRLYFVPFFHMSLPFAR